MTLDNQLQQLADLRYPRTVDVRQQVMSQIASLPTPTRHRPLWKPAAALAAAAMVAILLVNIVMINVRHYDLDAMGNTLVALNDYSSWQTVEEPAANPYDYFSQY